MRNLYRRRTLSLTFAGLALSLTVTGLSAASSSATAKPKVDLSGVTLRIAGAGDTTELLQASGVMKGAGYKVSWSSFPSGNAEFSALAAGQVDVVPTGEETPIYASASGQPIKVFYVGGPSSITHPPRNASAVAVLVPKNSTIHSIKDLIGKKIAVVPDNFSTYTVVAALRSIKASYSQITPVPIASSTAGAALFAAGDVDAISVNDQGWAPLVVNDGARVLLYSNKYIDNLDFLSADQSELSNPVTGAALRDFAIRYGKFELWQNTHTSAVAVINNSTTGLPLSEANIEAAYSHDTPLPLSEWKQAAKEQNTEANTLFNIGQLSAKVDFTQLLAPPKASQWPFKAKH